MKGDEEEQVDNDMDENNQERETVNDQQQAAKRGERALKKMVNHVKEQTERA